MKDFNPQNIQPLTRIAVYFITADIFKIHIREVFKKSKWKFKMAFAMKGGGGRDRSRVPHTYFEK